MPEPRRQPAEPGPIKHPVFLLHSFISDPDSPEAGLRILAMDRASNGRACLAWGLDRRDRPVALYVTSGLVQGRRLMEAMAPLIRALSDLLAGADATSGLPQGGPRGRILAVGSDFSQDLLRGPSNLPRDWALDLVLWRDDPADTAAELPEDVPIVEGEAPVDLDRGPARLSPEEVESLLSPGAASPVGSPP